MSGEAFRDYIADPDYGSYASYDDWVSQRRKRRDAGLPPTTCYKADKVWDWRDPEESWIEDLVLGFYTSKPDDRVLVGILGTIGFGIAWFVLNFVLVLAFNRFGSFTWEVPMDTGLIILFALCGTVLGSVAMWCVTVYKLRMAQLAERKEIRQAEVDKEMWKRIPMDQLRNKELTGR